MAIPEKKVPAVKKKPAVKKAPAKKRAPAKGKKPAGWPNWLKVTIAGLLLILLSPLYYGYVLKSISSTWRWISDAGTNPHYRVYKSFNIQIPDKYSIHGIDVSYYQGRINWPLVKRMSEDSVHITFAFIKATEGILQVDPYFQRNWREAAKAGIVCGAYHYFRPKQNGKWQAKFFLQNVHTEKGDLPMVVDVEELDGVAPAKMRSELTDFVKQVEAKTGVRPIIYSGLTFYQDNLAGYFSNYTLWIAHYYKQELNITSGTNWKFWQHSDKARVNGINHLVDFDAFKGDSVAFSNMLIR